MPNGVVYSKNVRIALNVLVLLAALYFGVRVFAIELPGNDFSNDLKTASSIIQTGDKILFAWVCPFLAAITLLLSVWFLIQQKIGLAAIAAAGAIILFQIPKIVKELSKSGGSQTIFSTGQLIDFKGPSYQIANHRLEKCNA